MPFYEYQCRACDALTEILQKVSDPPLRKCPACGRNQLTKLVSAPVFRLKGGGWYETDFKADGENKRNLVGAEKDEAKPAEAKPADAKADAKPEAKADAKADAKPEGKPDSRPASKTAAKARPTARAKPVRAAAKAAKKPARVPARRRR